MPVKIKNLTTDHIWLGLNSGDSLRLSPGQTSRGIREIEVVHNPKLEKLQRQRMIDIQDINAPEVPREHTDSAMAADAPATSDAPVPGEPNEMAEQLESVARSRSGKKSGSAT